MSVFTRRSSKDNHSLNPYAIDSGFEIHDMQSLDERDQGQNESNNSQPKYDLNPAYETPVDGEVAHRDLSDYSHLVPSLPRPLMIVDQKNNAHRGSNRTIVNPYALDAVEDEVAPSGTLKGVFNQGYEEVHEHENPAHQYAHLPSPKKPKDYTPSGDIYQAVADLNVSRNPRQKTNKLYEPPLVIEKKRTPSQSTDDEDSRCGCLQENRLIKLCLFVIAMLCLLCFFLLIMLITGHLGETNDQSQTKGEYTTLSLQWSKLLTLPLPFLPARPLFLRTNLIRKNNPLILSY